MAPLKIRRYQLEDREAVWKLHNIALETTGSHVGNGWWDDDLHDIQANYLNSGGEFLVGIHDKQLVAMGALKPVSDTVVELKRMRVHPDFQRRGFGQIMLEILEKNAKDLGYQTLQLDTTVLQTAAQRLYLKNGYKEIARQQVKFETIYYQKHL